MLDRQREHWQATFQANPDMYGTSPSQPGAYALGLFAREHTRDLLELGAGQGRDTLAFLRMLAQGRDRDQEVHAACQAAARDAELEQAGWKACQELHAAEREVRRSYWEAEAEPGAR